MCSGATKTVKRHRVRNYAERDETPARARTHTHTQSETKTVLSTTVICACRNRLRCKLADSSGCISVNRSDANTLL